MKQIIDIKNEHPQKGDMLVFNGVMWETVTKASVTANLEELIRTTLKNYEDRIKTMEQKCFQFEVTITNLNKEIAFLKGEDL